MNVDMLKSSFQFIGNRIVKLSIKNDFVYLDINDHTIKYNIDADYEVKQILPSDENISGIIQLRVKTEAKKGKKHFLIDLILEGCFVSDPSTKEDDFKQMLEINGSTALYSIARATVLQFSAQSVSGGQIILPMMNVFELKKQKDIEANNKIKN